jgi:hypothetical protein
MALLTGANKLILDRNGLALSVIMLPGLFHHSLPRSLRLARGGVPLSIRLQIPVQGVDRSSGDDPMSH